jgi:hypothetical protein
VGLRFNHSSEGKRLRATGAIEANFAPNCALVPFTCNERAIETPLNVKLPVIIEGTRFDMTGSSN